MRVYFVYHQPIDWGKELLGFDRVGVLFSYYDKGKRKMIEEYIQKYSDQVMVDSGAFSWYTKYVGKDKIRGGDYSWVERREFWDYFEGYVQWLKRWKLDERGIRYVVLDVIGNGELTYKMLKEMRERGLRNVMVVWHLGTDEDLLFKYMEDEELEWIGVSPPAMLVSIIDRVLGYLKSLFRLLKKKYGVERLMEKKFHLFGCTALDILKYVVYDTVDSASYIHMAVRGKIYVPLAGGENVREVYIPKEVKDCVSVLKSELCRDGIDIEIVSKVCQELFGVGEIDEGVVYRLGETVSRVKWNFRVLKEVYLNIFERYPKEKKLGI